MKEFHSMNLNICSNRLVTSLTLSFISNMNENINKQLLTPFFYTNCQLYCKMTAIAAVIVV